jgi:hypothetical protein
MPHPQGSQGLPIPSTIPSIDPVEFSINWPAQHDWLRRYFVFERATYALEALKMSRNNTRNNGFNLLIFGVQ